MSKMYKIASTIPVAIWLWFSMIFAILFNDVTRAPEIRVLGIVGAFFGLWFAELVEFTYIRRIRKLEEQVHKNEM